MSVDAAWVVERLEAVYGRPRFVARFDPMEELVSCILSQHSSDAASFPAFTRLREAFPDWGDLAAAGPDRLIPYIQAAGLAPQKARSIVACLTEIRTRTGAYALDVLRAMTDDEAMAWLVSLPGVGPKTASIVLCFALGRRAIPVDTHVYRVSWRLGMIDEKLGEVKAHARLLDLVPAGLEFRFHIALIQHGRVVCRAPLPNCPDCSLADRCAWLASGGPDRRRQELAGRRQELVARRKAKQAFP